MHIQLWDDNKEKALDMSKALGAPNKFINQFFDRIDSDNFINSMQELLRSDHNKIEIVVKRIDQNIEERNS